MSDRDGFHPGVPCWVETWHDDPEPAIRFYSGIFGWEAENTLPPDADGTFHICRLQRTREPRSTSRALGR